MCSGGGLDLYEGQLIRHHDCEVDLAVVVRDVITLLQAVEMWSNLDLRLHGVDQPVRARTDTGKVCRIPGDRLEEIFRPFVQLDSYTREKGGAGVGLTSCRRLAQLMGGDVTVESRLGEGSTFTLRLTRWHFPEG